MLRVWTDKHQAGILDRHGSRGTTFVYEPTADADRAVSLTMPVRVASWDTTHGLLPIFDMNLPEGALRARLTRAFAKATGTFDDFDLLEVVGRTQIGRIRYSAADATLTEDVPFQSIDEILKAKRGGGLYEYLLKTFAVHSGLSGIQPKVMIRGSGDDSASSAPDRQSKSFRSATHIVKLWEQSEYPELAANEYFCLSAAKAAGLSVPTFQLSDSGDALVIERFDLESDGSYLGFEDFCALNGVTSAGKYDGGYETRLFKRTREFVDPELCRVALEQLFRLLVLNCAIRNGDAHLKNFGVIYDAANGPVRLAPVYDLITTWVYIPNDPMALTLNGTTKWPNRRMLTLLGQSRCDLSLKVVDQIFEQLADVMSGLIPEIEKYFRSAKENSDIGTRLLASWQAGIRDSLGFSDSRSA